MEIPRKTSLRQKATKRQQRLLTGREAVPAYGLTKAAFERLLRRAAQPVREPGSAAS